MAAYKFESCTFKRKYVFFSFLEVPVLVKGNVYSFTDILGCYKYVEYSVTDTPNFEEVTIQNDYQCKSCKVCDVLPEPEPEPPCPKTGRVVQPGYTVPSCKTKTKC
jgi:hypothetical protein